MPLDEPRKERQARQVDFLGAPGSPDLRGRPCRHDPVSFHQDHPPGLNIRGFSIPDAGWLEHCCLLASHRRGVQHQGEGEPNDVGDR